MSHLKTNKPKRLTAYSQATTPNGAIYVGPGSPWAKMVKYKHPSYLAYEANVFSGSIYNSARRDDRRLIRAALKGYDLSHPAPKGVFCYASVLIEVANGKE